jgi:hypothetical protein
MGAARGFSFRRRPMSRVVLSRLWYIFPADDQNLRPDQFARKVKSYVRTLSPGEKLVLLEFLVVQYEAFQKQLELLFAHASVTDQEYHERAERLARYLDHLHAFLRSPDHDARREIPQRVLAFEQDSVMGPDSGA